jgi:hypothetical protein
MLEISSYFFIMNNVILSIYFVVQIYYPHYNQSDKCIILTHRYHFIILDSKKKMRNLIISIVFQVVG